MSINSGSPPMVGRVPLPGRQSLIHNKLDEENHPGAALIGASIRQHETILSGLLSRNTYAQRHVVDVTVYPSYPNCTVTHAACPTSWLVLVSIGTSSSQVLL
ncbi:hypothetical protein TNCV_1595751 [Trichonephila clavipes]|nr:hypothetical protein TNCV_1595751 [Trichonephila clavipes]